MEAINSFASSSACFWNVYESLDTIDSDCKWDSNSGAHYVDNSAQFKNLTRQIAALNQSVDTAIQNESEQVHNGRKTLENLYTDCN